MVTGTELLARVLAGDRIAMLYEKPIAEATIEQLDAELQRSIARYHAAKTIEGSDLFLAQCLALDRARVERGLEPTDMHAVVEAWRA